MSIGGHQSAIMQKDEWITPKYITDQLGPFDLDPCSPINRPWDTAKKHYTINDNGLILPWEGKIWCNPPYGKEAAKWLSKCHHHNNAISLIFARTETEMFFNHIWEKASAILFLKGRLTFHHSSGEIAKSNGGAPSVLIAYGDNCAEDLRQSGLRGAFISGEIVL
jgi:hypothetical protein